MWIDGLLYKLFTELGVGARIRLAIKDLYTGVKAKFSTQVPFPGSLVFHKVQVRGEYLPPFMYKVYINVLLVALSNLPMCLISIV